MTNSNDSNIPPLLPPSTPTATSAATITHPIGPKSSAPKPAAEGRDLAMPAPRDPTDMLCRPTLLWPDAFYGLVPADLDLSTGPVTFLTEPPPNVSPSMRRLMLSLCSTKTS